MLKRIKTKTQYNDGLARIYELMQKNLRTGSKETDELEILSILVKEYEKVNYPVPKSNPIRGINKSILK